MKRPQRPLLIFCILIGTVLLVRPLWSGGLSGATSPSMDSLYLFKDIDSSTDYPTQLTLIDNKLFFTVSQYNEPGPLWVSHGDANTTFQLTTDVETYTLIPYNKGVAFISSSFSSIDDVWVSDGTINGTQMIANSQAWNRNFSSLTAANSNLYFVAITPGGSLERPTQNVVFSDGTQNGTSVVKQFELGFADDIDIKSAVGDKILFTPIRNTARQSRSVSLGIWVSDGTTNGTHELFQTTDGPSDIRYPLEISNTLFFVASYGLADEELWKSDGTESGTVMVKDINPSGSSQPRALFEFSNKLYFLADDGTGEELWMSDGTESGTVMVKDINSFGGSSPRGFALLDNHFYFEANDGTHGNELWRSDGSESGTRMVADITSGPTSTNIGQIMAGHSRAFFTIDNNIWVTDGTISGTQFATTYTHPAFQGFQRASGDSLFFSQYDENIGVEIWKTDGTPTGTALIQDLNPNGDGVPFLFLTAEDIENTFFVGATDGTDPELWAIDGITKTRLAPTINNHVSETSAGLGNGQLSFTVTLNTALAVTYTVDYITVSDSATAGEDFLGTTETLLFPPGEVSASFTITVFDDEIVEPLEETFQVQLMNPSQGATGWPSITSIAITNDDWFNQYLPMIMR